MDAVFEGFDLRTESDVEIPAPLISISFPELAAYFFESISGYQLLSNRPTEGSFVRSDPWAQPLNRG